jgi:hypothetical protein
MDTRATHRGDGAVQEARREPWPLEGPRVWRPRITAHAILRYAQRVIGLELADDADVIGHLKAGGADLAAIYEMIWPHYMALPADPRCRFAMLRGGFCYPVRGGVLRTVIRAEHYCDPGPMVRDPLLQ